MIVESYLYHRTYSTAAIIQTSFSLYLQPSLGEVQWVRNCIEETRYIVAFIGFCHTLVLYPWNGPTIITINADAAKYFDIF